MAVLGRVLGTGPKLTGVIAGGLFFAIGAGPALADSFVTNPSQCPVGTTALPSGPPSAGVQIYDCTPGGSVLNTLPPVPAFGAPGTFTRYAIDHLGQAPLKDQPAAGEDNDPFIDVTTQRDNGAAITSASGTIGGQSLTSP
jgi:hypothetical protein